MIFTKRTYKVAIELAKRRENYLFHVYLSSALEPAAEWRRSYYFLNKLKRRQLREKK